MTTVVSSTNATSRCTVGTPCCACGAVAWWPREEPCRRKRGRGDDRSRSRGVPNLPFAVLIRCAAVAYTCSNVDPESGVGCRRGRQRSHPGSQNAIAAIFEPLAAASTGHVPSSIHVKHVEIMEILDFFIRFTKPVLKLQPVSCRLADDLWSKFPHPSGCGVGEGKSCGEHSWSRSARRADSRIRHRGRMGPHAGRLGRHIHRLVVVDR